MYSGRRWIIIHFTCVCVCVYVRSAYRGLLVYTYMYTYMYMCCFSGSLALISCQIGACRSQGLYSRIKCFRGLSFYIHNLHTYIHTYIHVLLLWEPRSYFLPDRRLRVTGLVLPNKVVYFRGVKPLGSPLLLLLLLLLLLITLRPWSP